MKPLIGAYRPLFVRALQFYTKHEILSSTELEQIEYYEELLHDTNYKFGKVTTNEKVYAPGELFFRSAP